MRSRYRGAMIGVAVGDALGVAFEGHDGPVPANRLRPHVDGLAALSFTDDAAMTIAAAESLLEVGDLDEDHLASAFARHHIREPWRGYSAGTAQLLAAVADGSDWRMLAPRRDGGAGASGDGAAMRAAPFGAWCTDPAAAASLARRGATVTHTHPHAVDAAGAQAAAVCAALRVPSDAAFDVDAFLGILHHQARTPELRQRIETVAEVSVEPAATVARRLGTGVAALEAVPAAICAFVHHPGSFVDTVCFAISLGGDTDTIAAMAGAISGAFLGDVAVPRSWLERVESTELLGDLGEAIFERRTTR